MYPIVFRINDNLINQYRRASKDKTATKYIILNDVEPIKIKDELVVKSKINDLLLVYNTRSQKIDVIHGSANVWKAVQSVKERRTVLKSSQYLTYELWIGPADVDTSNVSHGISTYIYYVQLVLSYELLRILRGGLLDPSRTTNAHAVRTVGQQL